MTQPELQQYNTRIKKLSNSILDVMLNGESMAVSLGVSIRVLGDVLRQTPKKDRIHMIDEILEPMFKSLKELK